MNVQCICAARSRGIFYLIAYSNSLIALHSIPGNLNRKWLLT